SEEINRMRADGESDRQSLAAGNACRVQTLEVGRRRDIRAGLVAVAQAQAPAADVATAAGRIDRVVDGRTDIAAAIERMLWMERQPGEVNVASLENDLMNRRIGAGYFDDLLRY